MEIRDSERVGFGKIFRENVDKTAQAIAAAFFQFLG